MLYDFRVLNKTNDIVNINIKRIISKKSKNLHLKANINGIFLTSPQLVDDSKIDSFLFLNVDWISHMYNKYVDFRNDYCLNYYDYDLKFYLGDLYKCYLIKDKNNFVIISEQLKKISFHISNIKCSKNQIKNWYKTCTTKIILDRISYLNKFVNAEYKKIKIKSLKSKWGSCSNSGNLNFNLFLSILPIEIIDYIILHELTHLHEFNHSKKFWNQLELYSPDYRSHIDKLKKYESIICV